MYPKQRILFSLRRFINYYSLVLPLLLLLPAIVAGQSVARITEQQQEILTYDYSDPDPVAIHLSKVEKIYPYTPFEGYSKEGKKKKWKVVKLENDYVEVYILPEVGGKIFGAIEKSTGKEFIYRNDVIKFRNIATRGPWGSGGVEFNFGIVGHHPATSSAVDYVTRQNDDGSVSCIVGNLDLPSRTNWRVEIRLPKDKAYVETHASWSNPTPIVQSYYNWMTGAAPVSDDLEFFYPGNIALEHNGEPSGWPVDDRQRQLSYYKNNAFGSHKSIHPVGEYNDFMGGYYHKSSFGFGHWALYDEMPGRKLWLWALSRNGGIWEELLTDHHGQYMEFQAGRLLNQYLPAPDLRSAITQLPFAPGVTDRWSEIWFPVKDIGGLSDVSPYGVLHVGQQNGQLQIGINSLSFAEAVVEISANGKVIATEARKFKPMEVYLKTISADPNTVYAVNVKSMDLSYTIGNKDLALKRPFVASPATPVTTAEALYREGVQLKEYREYTKAFGLLGQCLQKDSLHLGALAERAELYYRSGRYDSSLRDVNTVLRQDTYHPKANYVAGLSYKAQGDWVNALESLGWAARAMEFRSAAYAQMAAVCIARADYNRAEHYARQSLDFNAYNIPAWHALAVIHRKRQQPDRAREVIDRALAFDPLDHFAAHEKFLLSKSAADRDTFTGLIRGEQPHQAYLEIALEYRALGQTDDALALLAVAPRQDLIILWQAFLNNAPDMLQTLVTTSPAGVFPYRTETLEALTWAAAHNNHWKFRYYLAINSYALQRQDEAVRLLQACGDKPDYAPFYLTRSRLLTDPSDVLADLTRANRLAPDEWRTWKYLIDHYGQTGDYIQELAWAKKAATKFKDNYSLGFDHAKALVNNARYDEAANILKTLYILPFEGSDEGHAVFEQATLGQALALIRKKKYTSALSKLEESKQWPERLGVGKPYDPDTRLQDYLMAYCYDKLGKAGEAAALRQRIVDPNAYAYKLPLNNVLVLATLHRLGQTDKREALLRELKASPRKSAALQWVISAVDSQGSAIPAPGKALSGNRYVPILREALAL
jgi:hypothetical protein